ncbi:MAG: hypothetical protein E7529_01505 [Ruminococcaceae bacterium]|nr:hypothetical protein [Oscillospiraceae bacterium]
MPICKNCKYYDDKTKSGYKGYCTTYKEYVDPDSISWGCTRYEEGTGTSSGGCYLTSACVESKNLPDNCHELTVLRHFRDTYLISQKNGREEIQHYYATAPAIVEKINASSNSTDTWNEVYENMILPCVKYIEANELEKAHQLYKSYSLKLEKTYM